MEAGSFIDVESIREAMGQRSFDELERKLRDRWAAQAYFSSQKRALMAKAASQVEWKPNGPLGGLRPVFNMDYAMYVWLNTYEPGWQSDPSFLKSLFKYHPETQVKLPTGGATNRVGWTPSLNHAHRGQRHTPGVVLTDERGNAE